MMTLRRLVELGGCARSDWRLHVLISRMRKCYKRIVSFDALVSYMSSLGLHNEVELITRFLLRRLKHMKASQLVSVLRSFGNIQLRDTNVVGICTRYLRKDIPVLSSDDLIAIIRSIGSMDIRNSRWIEDATRELLKRDLHLSQFASLLEATRVARVRNYVLIELASAATIRSLESEPDLTSVTAICCELRRLQSPDVSLFSRVVDSIQPGSLRIRDLVSLASAISGIVDADRCGPFIEEIVDSLPLIQSKSQLADAIVAVEQFGPINNAESVFTSFANALSNLKHESTVYDVPRVAEIFAKNDMDCIKVWKSLVRDIQYSIPDFEPRDFLKTAEVLSRLPSDFISEHRDALADELAQWALKRWEEFTPSEWSEFENLLSAEHFSCSPWSKEQLAKWRPPLTKKVQNVVSNS